MSTIGPGIVKRGTSYNIDPKALTRREGWNPRFDFGEIAELARSIKANGLINPIHVKRVGDGFELIDGDRRFQAIELLIKQGEKFPDGIPAIIEDRKSTDLDNLFLMFEANSGKPFLPLEEAEAYRRMSMPVAEGGFGMSLKQISARVSRTSGHISDTLAILSADPEVQQALKDKKIGATVARRISKVSKDKQKEMVQLAATTKKGGRTQLNKMIIEERNNKRASTKAKVVVLSKADLEDLLNAALDRFSEKATELGWPTTEAGCSAQIKNDDAMVAAATFGQIMALRVALGIKGKLVL